MKDKFELNIDLALPDLGQAKRAVKRAVKSVKYHVAAFRDRDPAASSDLEVLLLYSGLHAVLLHRAAHALYTHGHKVSARAVSQGAKFLTGIELHPGATLGHSVFIDRGSGIVIGETAEIGDDCLLYQGVTLGGTGKDKGKRHPTLGNNVLVGSGAKVLGPFTVGDNARIAAGAVVLGEVPPGCTAVGVPARVVRVNGKPIYYADDVDQIHVADPVVDELLAMSQRIEELEKELQELKEPNKRKETA